MLLNLSREHIERPEKLNRSTSLMKILVMSSPTKKLKQINKAIFRFLPYNKTD